MTTASSPETDFQPPIEGVKLASYGDTRASATVLLADANHHLFSMHVETEQLYRQNLKIDRTETDTPEEDAEPTFVVPGQELNPDDLNTIIYGMAPDLLKKYLVLQSE